MWDVFISHAWEDKSTVVRPLAEKLTQENLSVWYDELTLTLGDSLRRNIDRGLANSRFGVVILSPNFLEKEWAQRELDALVARETESGKVILPVWHNVTRTDLANRSPMLADRVSVSTNQGLDTVVREILRVIRPESGSISKPKDGRVLAEQSMETNQIRTIFFSIENEDVLSRSGDVLVLKYAQASYGVDRVVLSRLHNISSFDNRNLPNISKFTLLKSNNVVKANNILFIGVEPLMLFGYPEIREFAKRALEVLHQEIPDTKEIIVTIHGAGYGLDEREAFSSQIAGFLDAIEAGKYPDNLERITIIERNKSRYQRLHNIIEEIIPGASVKVSLTSISGSQKKQLKEYTPALFEKGPVKSSIFIAMPFSEDMEDVYYYGIQNAVNAAGFLCERANESTFAGDITEWVKKRIESSSLVIADLTKANPNVYLEVGYAWGCKKPTILISQDKNDLHFGVKLQRCLIYKRIKDLEKSLHRELLNFNNHPEDFK